MLENSPADATQLPTGCQPESLAKPARRRSHKAAQPAAAYAPRAAEGGLFEVTAMALALALTTAQLETLRTVAAPLPRSLRAQYLERIGEALRGRDSVGDGELSRLAHAIVREILTAPQERQRAKSSRHEEALRGFDVMPRWS
jgi:hypothetical protein